MIFFQQERPGTGRSIQSHGSAEILYDDTDSSAARARRAIEHIQNKISKTKELIRLEQVNRDGKYFQKKSNFLIKCGFYRNWLLCNFSHFYMISNYIKKLVISLKIEKKMFQIKSNLMNYL